MHGGLFEHLNIVMQVSLVALRKVYWVEDKLNLGIVKRKLCSHKTIIMHTVLTFLMAR